MDSSCEDAFKDDKRGSFSTFPGTDSTSIQPRCSSTNFLLEEKEMSDRRKGGRGTSLERAALPLLDLL